MTRIAALAKFLLAAASMTLLSISGFALVASLVNIIDGVDGVDGVGGLLASLAMVVVSTLVAFASLMNIRAVLNLTTSYMWLVFSNTSAIIIAFGISALELMIDSHDAVLWIAVLATLVLNATLVLWCERGRSGMRRQPL